MLRHLYLSFELIELSTPQGTLKYEYDNLGRLWKLIKNETATTEYEYDEASRLVSILNPHNELTEFFYDDDGKLTRKNFHNGTYELYSYDPRSRLTEIVLKKSNNDVLSSYQYVYDAVSNIVSRTSNGVTTEFTYDLIDQLLTETTQGCSAEYTYDANGNRLTRTVNNVTENYEYDDADKLLNVKINNTPVKEYTYDDCGRLIEVESSAGTTYLSWDIRNRLTQITYPNSSTNTFGYNGFGARISKSDSTGNYTFLRNGTGATAPVLSDSYAEYTPGISERRSSNSKFYHSDLKNTTAQTNSDQNITGTNQYDAFGNLIDYSGTWNGPFTYGGAFGYQTDDDSGLMLLGNGYYDSSTGRFVAINSPGSQWNSYVYSQNNPLAFVNPFINLYNDSREINLHIFEGLGLGIEETLRKYGSSDKDGRLMILDKKYAIEGRGARVFHIDVSNQGRVHFNADIGPLKKYNHRPLPQFMQYVNFNFVKFAGRTFLAMAIVDDLNNIYNAPPGKKGGAMGRAAGGLAGAWRGAKWGGSIGARIGAGWGPVGSIIGGLAGAVAGGIAGGIIGDRFDF